MKVYLIGDDQGNCKIGISNNPAKRLKEFNTPQSLRLLVEHECGEFDEPLKLEALLHRAYAHKRVRGEWFKDVDVDDFDLRVAALALDLSHIQQLLEADKVIDVLRRDRKLTKELTNEVRP